MTIYEERLKEMTLKFEKELDKMTDDELESYIAKLESRQPVKIDGKMLYKNVDQ